MIRGTGVAAILVMASAAAWAAEDAIELGAPVAHEALEAQRGGESHYFELNYQQTTATMEKAAAIGNTTGANSIDGGSFAGASGFPVAVQNSGNNVIVQNAFIINLDVR